MTSERAFQQPTSKSSFVDLTEDDHGASYIAPRAPRAHPDPPAIPTTAKRNQAAAAAAAPKDDDDDVIITGFVASPKPKSQSATESSSAEFMSSYKSYPRFAVDGHIVDIFPTCTSAYR